MCAKTNLQPRKRGKILTSPTKGLRFVTPHIQAKAVSTTTKTYNFNTFRNPKKLRNEVFGAKTKVLSTNSLFALFHE